MRFVAVNDDGTEIISGVLPYRDNTKKIWRDVNGGIFELPKGSIEKLTGCKITWDSEPIELIEQDSSYTVLDEVHDKYSKQLHDEIIANKALRKEILSLELKNKDNICYLEKLEANIKNWYIFHGYAVKGMSDWFKLELDSRYKTKGLMIIDLTKNLKHPEDIVFSDLKENFTELFKSAFRFFDDSEPNLGNGVDHECEI